MNIETQGPYIRSPYQGARPERGAADGEAAQGESVGDSFTRSGAPLKLIPPAFFGPSGTAPVHAGTEGATGLSTASKVVVGFICGLALFSAASYMLSGTSAPALARGTDSSVQVVLSEAELEEAQQMGLSKETALKLKANPELEAVLRTIPREEAGRFKDYNAQQRSVMYKDITGKTWVGFVAVSNREAFVNGSVMGIDAFFRMSERLDAHVKQGHLTAAEAKQMKEGLPGLKALSPAQRDAIATVIEWECAPQAPGQAKK